MTLWRPCDDVEAHVAWVDAIERRNGPTSLVLTRQALPHQQRTPEQVAAVRRGGYVLADAEGGAPEAVLIATGSEVALAMDARRVLQGEGRRVRVVSMPSTSAFDAQPADYRDSVLPPNIPRIAVEAGTPDYWCRYVGPRERAIGIERFGASAPAKDLFRHFGLTPERVAEVVRLALAA
jgi:transketolase